MVEFSRIDKENGSRSVFIENKFTNTVLNNLFRVNKYSATGIILSRSCSGSNYPEENCPITNTKFRYSVKRSA